MPLSPLGCSMPTVALAPRSLALFPVAASRYCSSTTPVLSFNTSWNDTAVPVPPVKCGTPFHETTYWRLGAEPTVRTHTPPPALGSRSSHHGAMKPLGSVFMGTVLLMWAMAAPDPSRRYPLDEMTAVV